MNKRIKLALILAGLVVSLIALFLWVFHFSEWPGGMRATYAAADYDPRLTRVAVTATPLIAALQRYHEDHSAFPAQAADFASYLPNLPAETPGLEFDYILDWSYLQLEREGGYILSRSLGWDPSLQYHHDGSGARWVFNPGDGSPKKTIVLKP